MNIIIAPDSFKHSLSAVQAADAIKRGLAQVWPDAQYRCIPMADGGEGTAAALLAACAGTWVHTTVRDPLGSNVSAAYGLLPDGSAVMEMAAASGLALLQPEAYNPLVTSSYGTGQMIADALSRGVKHIILGLGGSATNDGGVGMAQALGIRFLDANGVDLPPGGGALAHLASIDARSKNPALDTVRISVACDVTNPLTGPKGASQVFAPQKGADASMVMQLDDALRHLADVVHAHGYQDERHTPGSGAAGGLGFGLLSFCNAKLGSGIDRVIQATGLHQHLADADLVITGEGRMDGQTAFGKVPLGILRAATAHNIPVIALAGSVGEDRDALLELGFRAIFPTVPAALPLAEVLAQADNNLMQTARQVAALWQLATATALAGQAHPTHPKPSCINTVD